MRIEEKMLVLPALYIIKRKGKATTSDLIAELTYVFNPSGEDAEILAGRNDTKFSQKVRNLVSHRDNNGMDKYTEFVEGIYTLTSEGENYLNTRIDELNYFFLYFCRELFQNQIMNKLSLYKFYQKEIHIIHIIHNPWNIRVVCMNDSGENELL